MNEALPVWTCEWQGRENLTVGAIFKAKCHGDIPVTWGEGPLEVKFAKEEDAYSLVVLNADKLSPNEADLTVTAYKPGEHQPEYARFTQGATSGFEVAKPSWSVKSVLDPQKPPQPVASLGPWSVGFPMWIALAAALVLALIGLIVWRTVRRVRQRRRMLDDLQRHKTAILPVHQFYRDARTLRRRLNGAKTVEELRQVAAELNREFRLYVLRQYLIPTLDWSDRQVVDDLRRRHRKVYAQTLDPLRRTLRELGKLAQQPNVLLADVEQLHRMSLDTVERMERARAEGGRK